MDPLLPVVWLCGPPGVGKTPVGWQLYRRAAADGRRVAFVDVDQLGICCPERAEDQGRHRLKARNVDALRRNFGAVGADYLIVSGVADAATGPAITSAGGDDAFAIRLRADRAELVDRLASRHGSFADAQAVGDEAAALDHARFDALAVDTTCVAVDEIAAGEVLSRRPPLWTSSSWPPCRAEMAQHAHRDRSHGRWAGTATVRVIADGCGPQQVTLRIAGA